MHQSNNWLKPSFPILEFGVLEMAQARFNIKFFYFLLMIIHLLLFTLHKYLCLINELWRDEKKKIKFLYLEN